MHLLSSRELATHPARTMIYQLEDLMVDLCEAKLLTPNARKFSGFSSSTTGILPRCYRKAVKISVGSFQKESPQVSPTEKNVLMIIALNGTDLQMLHALKNWRTEFDYVVSYLFDAWVLDAIPPIAKKLDRIIAPYPEALPPLKERFGVKVSAIPAGHNILDQGGFESNRPIDIASYGRSSQSHLNAIPTLQINGNPVSLYKDPGFSESFEPAQAFGPGRHDWDARQRLFANLRRSKTALAFENFFTTRNTSPGVHITDRLQHSILTQRWFECLGSGCVVIGKRPPTKFARSYLDWPNSTIELGGDTSNGLKIIKAVLEDTQFLAEQSKINYFECLRRNDWRFRIRQFYDLCSLPQPQKISDSIGDINDLYHRYKTRTV